MPLDLLRFLGSLSSLGVNLINPEKDPCLITSQYREMQYEEELTASPVKSPAQGGILTRLKLFRVFSRERLSKELTSAGRAVENTIFAGA